MDQCAAFDRCETGFRSRPSINVEPMQGDRLKRTIALRLDRVRTAANARAFG